MGHQHRRRHRRRRASTARHRRARRAEHRARVVQSGQPAPGERHRAVAARLRCGLHRLRGADLHAANGGPAGGPLRWRRTHGRRLGQNGVGLEQRTQTEGGRAWRVAIAMRNGVHAAERAPGQGSTVRRRREEPRLVSR